MTNCMIITPKNAIEFVLEKKAKDKSFQFYKTKLEKSLFWACILFFVAGVIVGLSTYYFKNQIVALLAMLSLLVSVVLMIAFQIACTVPELIKLKNPEKDISFNLLNNFNDDIDLINELSNTFEVHHLRYAQNCYQYMAKQLRERISLLVGTLSKIGIIPLAVTGYISYSKIQDGNFIFFDEIEWILVSFIFLYLLAIRMTFTAQWMEQVVEIYSESLKMKGNKC
ncbi:MAG: hypothetical protein D3924_02510 [Candidatus Electrothrix sp. AR4]|nr:hypothetical protein [Candidatus Electrothrix sp. AR4]